MRLCPKCERRTHVIQKLVILKEKKDKKRYWTESCSTCGWNWEIVDDENNPPEKGSKWFKYYREPKRRR